MMPSGYMDEHNPLAYDRDLTHAHIPEPEKVIFYNNTADEQTLDSPQIPSAESSVQGAPNYHNENHHLIYAEQVPMGHMQNSQGNHKLCHTPISKIPFVGRNRRNYKTC